MIVHKRGASNGDAVKTVTYNAEVMEVVIVGMHFKIGSAMKMRSTQGSACHTWI